MRTIRLIALVAVILPLVSMQTATSSDEQAIRRVLREAYVQGMYVQHDEALLRSGLAPTFVMQVCWDGKLSRRTLDEWLVQLKLDGTPTTKKMDAEIDVLEVTGVTAVARVDLHVDGWHKHTDYFGLYRTNEGWKMVTKMFHAWPRP